MKIVIMTAIAALALAGPAFADGHATSDAAAGADTFGKCKACHSIVEDAGEIILRGGRNGPNLYGIHNRTAGTVEEFRYGDSIVEAGAAGLVWTEEEFVGFVADPKGYLAEYLDDRRARSKMSFRLRDEQDVRDVWAYLVSVGPTE